MNNKNTFKYCMMLLAAIGRIVLRAMEKVVVEMAVLNVK
jgi:hypothetical protein